MRHALSLALLLTASASAQNIQYEKYTLDNGLTVILHEDHALPVAAIDTWFHVGARDEPPGRSGFAHLFEHLMFMGTQRVPNGQFDSIMEAGGGSNNASTSLDRTNYYSVGPASLIPTLLWLDADRLEDLARAMDTAKLDRQRDVVRNEIRQQVENAPYGKAEEYTFRLMYPKGHPYHEAVYGTHEDLESANVFNVKDFFATFYVPRNASLVVAGDFDAAKVKPLITQLFGTLPGGAPVAHRAAEPVHLDHVVRATMVDKVQLPLIKMAWHSPAQYQDGDAEMDLLAALLSQGKDSRLYKRLVYDDKIAVDVTAHQDSGSLGSMFIIDVTTNPDADLTKVESTIDEELARLANDGIPAPELAKRQATIELAKLASLQNVRDIADKLNEYEYFWGEPNSFKRDLDRYRNATPAKVQWWAKRILDPSSRAIIRVVPEEPDRGKSARDTRPQDFPPQAFDPTLPQTFTLSNGANVMLWRKPELPLISLNAVFPGGAPLDDPAHAGLAALAAQMTEEGAGDLDALAFASALQSLGATYSAGAAQESASAGVTVLKRNFDKAAALMADALRRPRNTQEDWDRVKRLQLEDLHQELEEPTAVAAKVGLRQLFGDSNPYAWPTGGTIKTVESFDLSAAKTEQSRIFAPARMTVLVAGDITPDEAKPILEKAFGDWKGGQAAPMASANLAAPTAEGMRFVLVDRPEAVQTVIRFVMPGPAFNNDHRAALDLINTLFGGGFTSRINQNIREAHGYAYGAGSRFVMGRSAGYFIASSSVKADVTGPALQEFFKEFDRLRNGDITPEEKAKAYQTQKTELVDSFQGLHGIINAAGSLIVEGAPFSTLKDDMAKMQSVTDSDLNSLTKQAIPLDHGVLVLVGDRKLILAQIKDMKLPTPVELTAEGDPVSKSAQKDDGDHGGQD